jgi:hypothetical protein
MRIRVFRAFASNNSGSYTLVGGFRAAEDAEEAAAFLSDLCERETRWREGEVQTPPSPLDEAATALGLEPPGAEWDEWPDPSYAAPPSVVRIDCQVLVHVRYTASMPRVLGAMMYAKKGRVELELNHSHERLAAELQFWAAGDETAKLEAVRSAVDAVLPELTAPGPRDRSGAIAPAWHLGEWRNMNLSVVFRDLAAGVLVVRAIAAREGVRVFLRIREVYANDPDPFAVLRGAASRLPGGS